MHGFVQLKKRTSLHIITVPTKKKVGERMDLNTVSTIFANLGVPVSCLAVTFYLWYQEMQSHKEEVNKLQEALNNNTLVLQKLLDRMGEGDAN